MAQIDDDSMMALSAAHDAETPVNVCLQAGCVSDILTDLRAGTVNIHNAICLLNALENPGLKAPITLNVPIDVAFRDGLNVPNSKSLIAEIIHILDRKLRPRAKFAAIPAMPALPPQKMIPDRFDIESPSLRVHTQHRPK